MHVRVRTSEFATYYRNVIIRLSHTKKIKTNSKTVEDRKSSEMKICHETWIVWLIARACAVVLEHCNGYEFRQINKWITIEYH